MTKEAAEVTGDRKYWEAAEKHARNTVRYTIREDGSTYHTYYFDGKGNPIRGVTCQGPQMILPGREDRHG